MTKRDEFTAETKRSLALRAAHFCSNPRCMKLTSGPHSDPEKALTTGHAAHIHAAAPDGPRYDPNQTPAQRKAISNGLWLCRECGDIVDKDTSPHDPDVLRQWKRDHEALIAEVRTKGYAASLNLMQARHQEAALVKRLVAILEDRRVLWAAFDAEFPDRVRRSLDDLRRELTTLRAGLPEGSAVDSLLLSLTKTIHTFFDAVEKSDLSNLKCNGGDPEWLRFRDALATLRKSVGLQVLNLANASGVALSADLKGIAPSGDAA